MSHLILTVCKGNIHRSVLAEACISKYLQELGLEGSFKVASRGLQGTCGTAMPKFPNMRCYSLEYGYTEPILQELEIEMYRQVNLTIHATAKNGIQKMCQLAELLNPQTSKGE